MIMDKVLISIGPLKIYWYSITMLLAILTGMYLTFRESKKQNLNSFFEDLSYQLIIFGIIGARLYYVIFNFEAYRYDLLGILRIWEGGLAIYGAIIAGFLVIVYNCQKKHQSIIKTTDIIVPGLILAQSIGRWGNFFNQEAHGIEVSLSFLENLHLPKFIIEGMYINGLYYHPTFLYESIWCLLGFLIFVLIRKLSHRKWSILTYCYFIWYGFGRLFIEELRTDSLYLGTIRISQLVSLLLIIIGLIGLIFTLLKERRKNHENKL